MKKKLLQEQREKAIIESFAKNFNSIKRLDEQQLDEINFGKGFAALGLAAGMMGAPDASAQTQIPQGIEKSADTSAMSLPQDNVKAGKVIYDSYVKNPFTADMWSKRSRENLRFFKLVKKLVDYRITGGQIERSDLEQLGLMANQSSVAVDFLQRKKDDMTTARLEEEGATPEKNEVLQALEKVKRMAMSYIKLVEEYEAKSPVEDFWRGANKGASSVVYFIDEVIKGL
jgi:hypothetical protein